MSFAASIVVFLASTTLYLAILPAVTQVGAKAASNETDSFSDRIMALDDEYIAMIGMGVLILLLMIVITVLICTVGTRRRTKS
ncbi:hypothetical protein NP493_705g03036 [Ridgeia piscesae]|uniref:Uncharacterized protein n=1 Tax=Ridgeia piscesae TaxID=27915 RepID=A0AAD9KR27_RIDPI|nr:hypothetical protein NP493_705g03036 [Ridgeia piscesae]